MFEDKAARLQALDTSASFIVQAPAGSGKTELLIQRYLKLLATVDSPENVVSITFTRKAAGEMRHRVIEALRAAETGLAPAADHERVTFEIASSVLAQARARGWHLSEYPGQMRIETIDALCAAITRRMPWLARFGAMPEISENAADLYREAARNTLRHVDDDAPWVSSLLLHLDNDFEKVERLIQQMLEKRDQWLRHTGAKPDFPAIRAALETSLEKLIVDHLQLLSNCVDDTTAGQIAAVLNLARFPDAELMELPRWKEMVDLLLTTGGKARKRIDARLLAILENSDALLDGLRHLRELPEPRFTEAQWQAMQAAVAVSTLAVAELHLVFREHGRVDFAELAIRASAALGQIESPSDLALALGHRIQHILVDEFQDTSYTQFELLEKLTVGWQPGDGRTLFLVGDPMQSIYRFRQADVSLFLKARRDGIGSISLHPLSLCLNFRSTPDMVSWVNRTFEQILPKEDDLDSGAVAFSSSVSAIPGASSEVSIHALRDEQDEAGRVLELVQPGPGENIAILVRSRAHLVEVISIFKQCKIPFQAVEIDQLGERPIIQDLLALTFALLHLADRVSWLAVLRAPWCGLMLRDLDTLAGGDRGETIWDLLQRKTDSLTEDGSARIRRVVPALERGLAERGRRSLRNCVEDTWVRLGGPGCVEDETDLEDVAAYFDLLEGIEEAGDLADFEWLREQVGLLFAPPNPESSQRLQLMTIHKAKGLEFDTVILPGLGSTPRRDDSRLLLWLEHRGELLLAPISESGRDRDPIYRYLNVLEQRKSEQETARLLYVAATRARRRLHLLSVVKTKDDGSIAEPVSGSLLKLLWPAVAEVFAAPVAAGGDQGLARIPATIRRVRGNWKAPTPPPAVQWESRAIGRTELPRVTYDWAGDRLRHIGTALHLLLQRVGREGIEKWDEQAVRARLGLYEAVLANLGVGPADLQEAARRVEAGLLNTIRDPRGQWILSSHSDAQCEFRVTGLLEGKISECIVDRTFVDEAGVRWIIDYKTSDHQGGDLDNFFEAEKERYREQLERYARLMFQADERPIRLGLYFPLLGGWREWAAPVVLRKQAALFEL